MSLYILRCLIKLNSKNLGLIGGHWSDEEVHLNKSVEEETLCETEDPPAWTPATIQSGKATITAANRNYHHQRWTGWHFDQSPKEEDDGCLVIFSLSLSFVNCFAN